MEEYLSLNQKSEAIQAQFPEVVKKLKEILSEFPDLKNNIFDFLWRMGGWVEGVHSGIIAWMLSSFSEIQKATEIEDEWMDHKCGTAFLKAFLKCTGIVEEGNILDSLATQNEVVYNPSGVIDILLKYMVETGKDSKAERTVVIENKASGGDPAPQLMRYQQAFKADYYVGITLTERTLPIPFKTVCYRNFALAARDCLTGDLSDFSRYFLKQWTEDLVTKSQENRWIFGETAFLKAPLFQIVEGFNFLNDTSPFKDYIKEIQVMQGTKIVTQTKCKQKSWDWTIIPFSRGMEARNVGSLPVHFHFGLNPDLEWFKARSINARVWIYFPNKPPAEYKRRVLNLFNRGLQLIKGPFNTFFSHQLAYYLTINLDDIEEIPVTLFKIDPPFTRGKISKIIFLLSIYIKELDADGKKILDFIESNWEEK